ncbi:MAG: dual specificity protein phosphatase family protein [Fimbriiglobus sp.]
MRKVADYPIWIGNARDARNLRAVLDAGIEAVVDLTLDEPPVAPTRELVYLRFPLLDGPDNPPWRLEAATDAVGLLAYQGVRTLVACGAGMSRSPAITAAALALIDSEPRTADEVLAKLTECGPVDVSPGLWADVSTIMRRRLGR